MVENEVGSEIFSFSDWWNIFIARPPLGGTGGGCVEYGNEFRVSLSLFCFQTSLACFLSTEKNFERGRETIYRFFLEILFLAAKNKSGSQNNTPEIPVF